MKMAGPDIILFVIGAVLFAGAGYGLVATGGGLGGATSALGVFNVEYSTSVNEVESMNVGNFGGTTEHTFTVTEGNVSKVIVTVACTDLAGPLVATAPFTLVLKVAGPSGLATEQDVSGTCGSPIEATIDVTESPVGSTVLGRTEDEARGNLPTYANANLAQGTWTATISGARNPQPPVAQTNPSGSVTLSVEQWAPRFIPVQR